MDELDELLGEEEKETPEAPKESNPEAGQPGEDENDKKLQEEAEKKQQHLDSLNDSIAKQNALLKKLRAETKAAKRGEVPKDDEEDLPRIDLDDPSSKAWDRHVSNKLDPIAQEIEQEKEEIRTFALREFLNDKPNLARNPERLKRLMQTYEKIRTASERTREGVLIDLNRAYAAENYENLLDHRRSQRVDQARAEALAYDIGVSSGSTAYPSDRGERSQVHYSREDAAILARWGMSPSEHAKLKAEQDKKKAAQV